MNIDLMQRELAAIKNVPDHKKDDPEFLRATIAIAIGGFEAALEALTSNQASNITKLSERLDEVNELAQDKFAWKVPLEVDEFQRELLALVRDQGAALAAVSHASSNQVSSEDLDTAIEAYNKVWQEWPKAIDSTNVEKVRKSAMHAALSALQA